MMGARRTDSLRRSARSKVPASTAWRVARSAHQKSYIAGELSHSRRCCGSGSRAMLAAASAPPQLASSTSGARPAWHSASYMPR